MVDLVACSSGARDHKLLIIEDFIEIDPLVLEL